MNIAISKSCYLRNYNNDINITRGLLIFSNTTRAKFSEIIELFEVSIRINRGTTYIAGYETKMEGLFQQKTKKLHT